MRLCNQNCSVANWGVCSSQNRMMPWLPASCLVSLVGDIWMLGRVPAFSVCLKPVERFQVCYRFLLGTAGIQEVSKEDAWGPCPGRYQPVGLCPSPSVSEDHHQLVARQLLPPSVFQDFDKQDSTCGDGTEISLVASSWQWDTISSQEWTRRSASLRVLQGSRSRVSCRPAQPHRRRRLVLWGGQAPCSQICSAWCSCSSCLPEEGDLSQLLCLGLQHRQSRSWGAAPQAPTSLFSEFVTWEGPRIVDRGRFGKKLKK